MKQAIRSILLLALALTATAALAKGDFDRITISGPGLQGEVEVTDRPTLDALGMISLTGSFSEIDAPTAPGNGYEITRSYWDAGRDAFIAFDHVMFYPGEDGATPIVQYIGIMNGSSEYDGDWFQPTEEAARAMDAIVAEHGAVDGVVNLRQQITRFCAKDD
jgi:hypothetical protein